MQFDESASGIPGGGASISRSHSGSFHRGGAAAMLSLAPTVGSRVVLTSKQSDRDAFIWEDKEVDLEYITCISTHMLVGHVLREADTQLNVRFTIPYQFLPPSLRGRLTSRELIDKKKHEEEENKEEDDNNNKNEENMDISGEDPDVGGIEEDGEESNTVMREISPRDDPDMEICSGGIKSATARFVVGIVPVLTLTQEPVTLPSPRSRAKTLHLMSETRRSDRTSTLRPSSPQNLIGSNQSQSMGAATVQSVIVSSDLSHSVIHVSLSVAKRCCTSLLQSLLEQHDKLNSLNTAFASSDFKSAAQHILSVIEQRRILAKQRKDECKNLTDSWRSSLTWVQPHHHSSQIETNRGTDEISEDRHTRLIMVFRRDRENSSCLEFQPLSSNIGNEEENWKMGSNNNKNNSENTKISETEGKSSVELDKLQALQLLLSANSLNQELAPLYALLSFVRFHDGHYQQCLEDAVTALAHDGTCIEAYTRVMAGFLALGSVQDALVAAAVAIKRCNALSPEFIRLSRAAQACAFFYRNLGEYSRVDVLPRVRQSSLITEIGSVREVATLPKLHKPGGPRPTFQVRKFSYSSAVSAAVLYATLLPLRSLQSGSSPPMDYFSRSLRARAAISLNKGDVVFCEKVSLQVLLWPPTGLEREVGAAAVSPFSEDGGGRASGWALCRSRFCAYCGYPLVSKQVLLAEVREETSKVLADRIRWGFSGRDPLPCAAECGDYYCGEVCRNRAAVEYHSMECPLFFTSDGEEESSCRRGPTIGRETAAKPRASAPSALLTGAVGSCTETSESFPSPSTSFNRPGVRQLVSIRRRRLRNSCSGLEGSLSDAQFIEPQKTPFMPPSHISRLIMEDSDQHCSSSFTACRIVAQNIRAVFKSHYATVKSAIRDQVPNATITALLMVGRVVANVLSLLLPAAALRNASILRELGKPIGLDCNSRDRSTSIKKIITRYASRGFTSSGTSPSDRYDAHGLCLAEEVLQQINIPFFADTNLTKPITVWELLDESPAESKKNKDDTPPAAATLAQNFRRGFESAAKLLRSIDNIIENNLREEAVAFSLAISPDSGHGILSSGGFGCGNSIDQIWTNNNTDDANTESYYSGSRRSTQNGELLRDVGSQAVWLAEEHSKLGLNVPQQPSVWTFGRLLGFLGKRRFMEQLWDFCLSSYCVVPKCVLTLDHDENIPEHLREGWERICRRYTVSVAVMSPLSSIVSDLSTFAGDACSRFFSDTIPDSPRNPLFFRKGESSATSLLSINSLSHEPDDLFSRGSGYSTGGSDSKGSFCTDKHLPAAITSPINLETSFIPIYNRSGERRVMMTARRPIPAGEELRYECSSS